MCYSQQIVGTDTTTASINIKTSVQVRFVETFDACVKTYDPQWADEEDTRSSEVIYDNYSATKKTLDQLQKDGYILYGYRGNDECSVEGSTFPKVLTIDGSEYFVQYVSRKSMAEAAKAQGAFKRVVRIYLKGLEDLNVKVYSELARERKAVIDSLK